MMHDLEQRFLGALMWHGSPAERAAVLSATPENVFLSPVSTAVYGVIRELSEDGTRSRRWFRASW